MPGVPLRVYTLRRCRALFLHVITYNTQAMSLYTMQGFACVARLSHFYYISTGRQPDPNTQVRRAQFTKRDCQEVAA
jgi:hypothetical protein